MFILPILLDKKLGFEIFFYPLASLNFASPQIFWWK